MAKVSPISAAERLVIASKKNNFNIRDYAKWRHYTIASGVLKGTTLGVKNASLKILIGDLWNSAIFAIVKNGKVLGAKSIKNYKDTDEVVAKVTSVVDKLHEKNRFSEQEFEIIREQIPFYEYAKENLMDRMA